MIFMNNGDDTISISLENKTMNIQQQNQQQINQHQQIEQNQPSTSSGTIPHPISQTISSNINIPSSVSLSYISPSLTATGRQKKPKQLPKTGPLTLDNFWPSILEEVEQIKQVDAKNQNLPLARIKKIMKLDENAKMIAAEAPLLFAKACEYFIQELTVRAWVHTEENKRRTLQRSDIATALARCDQFDFLIDIVPREEVKSTTSSNSKKDNITTTTTLGGESSKSTATSSTTMPEQIQYFLGQLGSNNFTASLPTSPQQPQQITIQAPSIPAMTNQTIPINQLGGQNIVMTPQNIIINQQQLQQYQQQPQPLQFLQQVLTQNGEIQNIPITITPNQIGLIRMQMQPNQIAQHQQVIIQQPGLQPQLVQLNAGQMNPSGQIIQQANPQIFTIQQQQQPTNQQGKLLNHFQSNC